MNKSMIFFMYFIMGFLMFIPNGAGMERVGFFLVGSRNGATPELLKTYYLKSGDSLTLYPVIRKGNRLYSMTGEYYDQGKRVKTIHAVGRFQVKWFQIAPVLKGYDNSAGFQKRYPFFNGVPVEYRMRSFSGKPELTLPALPPGTGYGTYYVTPVIQWGAVKLKVFQQPKFPAKEPLHEAWPHQIIQVVRRADDSYLGYLTELYLTPFILGPYWTPHGFHQTDLRVGSDCAAFAIYGKRRQGFRIPYCGPKGIYQYLDELSPGPLVLEKQGNTFVYLTRAKTPVKVGPDGLKPGDIIHFTEQVAVFYQDRGIPGVFDKDDGVMESYGRTPHVTTMENSGFFHWPVRIFRWKGRY